MLLFQGMGYPSIMHRQFEGADSDADGFLDSLEWLQYLRENKRYKKEDSENAEMDRRR